MSELSKEEFLELVKDKAAEMGFPMDDDQDFIVAVEEEEEEESGTTPSFDDFGGVRNINLPDPSLINYWRDRAHRTIWIDEEINSDIVSIVRWIQKWNEDDKGIPVEEREPIKLMINSPGGLLRPSIAVCDAILLSKTPVYGYNVNECASAAALIYSCCTKRFAMPNSYFLLHLGQGGCSGTYQQTRAAQSDYNVLVDTMLRLYKKNLSIDDVHEFDRLIDGEWYLYTSDTEENSEHNAKRYNLITDEWTSFYED